jgi:hypothetical protein
MDQEKFEQWCIVELFGHQKIAGFVSNSQISGATFIRVDVPQVKEGAKEFTRFYNPSAVYGINPVTEQVAREMAKRIDSRPVVAWDIGFDPQRQLSFGHPSDNREDEDDFHDEDLKF